MKYFILLPKPDENGNNFKPVSKKETDYYLVYLRAPKNKQRGFEKKIKAVRGCTKFQSLNNIEMNVLSKFRAGDPILFIGKARGIIRQRGGRHLTIELHRLPGVFIDIYIGHGNELNLQQKIL